MTVRFAELLRGPDDLKLVYGFLEVAQACAEDGSIPADLQQFFDDCAVLNGAWYQVPNGGYAYLLENVPEDPLTALRDACRRIGHDSGATVMDRMLDLFPGRAVPRSYRKRKRFLEAADAMPWEPFEDIQVVPAFANAVRARAERLVALDRIVDEQPDPGALPPDADAATAAAWLSRVNCKSDIRRLAPEQSISMVEVAQFRTDLDRIYEQLADWRGAGAIEHLAIKAVSERYWRPVPLQRFRGLRFLNVGWSAMPDEEVDAVLACEQLERCCVTAATRLSRAAERRVVARFGDWSSCYSDLSRGVK